jgi:hypothetical protein
MAGVYYTNAWDAKSQLFMSTRLRSEDGSSYPVAKVFKGAVLDQEALAKYGLPRLTGTFAYSMFIANAAVNTNPVKLIISHAKQTLDWRLGRSCVPLLGWGCC